jgi:YbbR domain-containing protein
LDIRATTSNGSVLRISPSSVTVQIDKLTTKRVPIEVDYEGDLSANYWHGEPVLSKTEVEISGAYSILSSIASAICKVPLASRTESFSNSISLILVDSNGFIVNSNLLYGDLPSVTVALTIFPQKVVSLDVLGSLIGNDNLKNNYEIYEIITSPATVTIIGETATLADINKLQLERWDIAGASKNLERELKIVIPEGVTVLGDITSVIAYVNIREKILEKTFEIIPITVRNLGRDFDCTLIRTAATITISGKISVINRIKRGDIELYIDLKGLKAPFNGDMPINVDFGSDSLLDEITVSLDNPTVTVIISDK